MHNAGFSSDRRMQSAFLENFQHRDVLWQDFGDQFLEPDCTAIVISKLVCVADQFR